MSDLQKVIAQLANQMKIAADKLSKSSGSASTSTTSPTAGTSQSSALDDIKREIEQQEKLGASYRKINDLRAKELEIRAKNARQAAIDSNYDKQKIKDYEKLRREYNNLIKSSNQASEASKAMKSAMLGISEPLKALGQQITGFNSGVYQTGKALMDVFVKGARPTIGFFKSLGKNTMSTIKNFAAGGKAAFSFGMAMSAAWDLATFGISLLIKAVVAFIAIMMGPFVGALGMVDKTGAAFARATGTSDRWNESMIRASETAYIFGVSAEDAAASMAKVTQQFSAFATMSVRQGTEMFNQVLIMEKLGVASATQIKLMDNLNRVMGQSVEQSMKMTRQLFDMASAARMAPEEMLASWSAATPQLSVYGSKMTTEFMKLTARAKSTGLSISELLEVAGKFDTFEGAASAAQSLNAFLGGPYLNTIEMLTATESERIDLLRDSFARAGKDFNKMDRFMQRGIAQQLGVGVDKLRRQMNASTAEIQKHERALRLAAQANTNLKERVLETAPMMDTLKMAFMELSLEMMGSIAGTGKQGDSMMNMKEVMKTVYKEVLPALIKGFFGFAKVVLLLGKAITHVLDAITFWFAEDQFNSALDGMTKMEKRMEKMEPKLVRRMKKIGTEKMSKMNDFIYADGKVTPIDARDRFVGVKPTGHLDTSSKQMSSKIDALTAAINRLAGKGGGGETVIQMDGREVARLVDKRIQESYSFNLPSSGRIR